MRYSKERAVESDYAQYEAYICLVDLPVFRIHGEPEAGFADGEVSDGDDGGERNAHLHISSFHALGLIRITQTHRTLLY